MSYIAPSSIVAPPDRRRVPDEPWGSGDEPAEDAPYLHALENARARLIRRMTSAPALHALVEGWHGARRDGRSELLRQVAVLRRAIDDSPHLACAPIIGAGTGARIVATPSPHSASRLLRVRETADGDRPLGVIVVRDGGAEPEPALVVTLADLAGLHREIVTRRAPLTCVRMADDGAYAIDALRLFEIAAFSTPQEELRNQALVIAREALVRIGVFREPDGSGRDDRRLHLNASALRQEMLPHRPSRPYADATGQAHAA